VIVRGRVQGVAFRAATHRRAREVGAAGWVRNLPDGSVEAVFEGDPEVVRVMLEFCRTGPRHARVDALDDLEEPPEGLEGFEVR
jgi:acylphosphatase